MKKRLLIIVMSITCLGLSAQSISTKAPKASISKAKTSRNLDRSGNTQQSQKVTVATAESDWRNATSTYALGENTILSKVLKSRSENIKPTSGLSVENALRAQNAAPDAFYRRPEGYFFWGYTEDYRKLPNRLLLGPAYESAIWENYSIADIGTTTFKWSFTDPSFTTEIPVVFTDIDAVIKYPYAEFEAPTLVAATVGETDSEYKWAGFVITGGDATAGKAGEVQFGAGNYDIDLGFTMGRLQSGGYLFGTQSDSYWAPLEAKLEGIGNFFEKPARKYMFTKLWINCGNFEADADAELTLVIHRVNEKGQLVDTIATSVCYAGDVTTAFTQSGVSYNTIPFTFVETDPETGLESDTYLEIEDAILVEFKGYNNGKVQSIAPFFQYDDHPTGDSYAYAFFRDNATGKPLMGNLANLEIGYTSFLFNMDVTYPFMLTRDNKYEAPVGGDTHEFEIISYWGVEDWWFLDNELPSWISFGEVSYNAEKRAYILPVTAEALPSGVAGRHANVKIMSYAADVTLEIIQGDQIGISLDTYESAFNAVRQGDDFVLSYPEDVTAVAVFNIAGQKVAEYALNAGGEYVMPAANLVKGVYVLKFAGHANSSLKIVK